MDPRWRLGSRLAAGMLLGAAPAWAQATASPVEVVVAAQPDVCARLQAAVGAGDRPLRWTRAARVDAADILRRPSDPAAPPARVWVDASRSDRLRLFFANWATERFLARDVPLPAGLDAIALETIAQLIESSVAALLSDAAVGMTRAEMTSALTPPPSSPSAATSPPAPPAATTGEHSEAPAWRARAGAFYEEQAFAGDPPVEGGPGLLTHVARVDGAWSAGAWLSAQYGLPVRIDSAFAGARLDTVALRAGAEGSRATGARTAIEARAGAGVDVVHIAPRTGDAGDRVALAADRFTSAYVAHAAVAFRVSLGLHVLASMGVVADVDLAVRHYDVAVDNARVRVATLWLVRPGLLVEVGWQ